MPGKNLTRDEARERADLLAVDVVRRRARPDHRSDDVPRATTTVRFDAATEGAATFIDLIAESVQSITLNGESLDPAHALRRGRGSQLPALRRRATS